MLLQQLLVSGSGSALTGLTGASAGTYGASTNTPIITVDSNGRITGISTVATSGAGGGGGISNILEDTTPQLGGNLDLNSKIINGSGNLDYTGNLKVTGISTITGVAGFSSHVTLPDHAEIQVGSATGGDLKIYHDGSESYVAEEGTGGLTISSGLISFKNQARSETHATMTANGAVSLYYNNAEKFKTNSTGVRIIGDATLEGHLDMRDSDRIRLGAGDDLQVYHDGTDSWVDNDEGDLYIRNTGDDIIIKNHDVLIQTQASEGAIIARGDGQVELYYDNSKKLETTNTGVTVTGAVTGTTIVKSGGTSSQYLMADGSVSTTAGISTNSNNIQATWSVTANGASAYRFANPGNDGVDDNPDLYLVRGQRYRFTNNSGGSHPFQIRSVVGGSAYSAGVTNNGASSGNIEFNVQHDAPSRLFYQCTAHSGMVGNIYITGGGQWENTSVAASGTPKVYTDYNVGIGTDTPGAILEVFDATSNTILNVKSGDSGAVLNLIDDSARSSIEQNGTTLKISSDTGAEDASSDIRLQVDGSSKMIIRDSGDVVTGVPAHDNQNNTGSRTVFTVADTTNGALLHVRGQSPAIFFDQSSGNIGKVFLDSVDFAIQSGTPASEGSERLRITSAGGVTIGSGNNDSSMSEFGSNTGGLTIDDAGVNNTGIRLSHGNDDSYLGSRLVVMVIFMFPSMALVI